MILDLSPADLAPDRTAVLAHLGIPPGAEIPRRIERLHADAADLFAAHVAPAGVLADVTADGFAEIYGGEGRNAPAGPVSEIFPRAEHLALFAVTLGSGIGTALTECFAARDFALAYMLDAMASVGADQAAEVAEQRYGAILRSRGWTTPDGAALRYSPGYCGWDVSGQQKLFAYLQPGVIGLTLTPSCVMQPLKSVSGVLIAGPRTIHRFRPSWDFCDQCEDRTCRGRLGELFGRHADGR
jgi:hypothetical protein